MILYLVSLLTLLIIGRCYQEKTVLKHASYCKYLYSAVYLLIRKISFLRYDNRNLMFLYGRTEIRTIHKVHLSLKVTSSLLFTSLPVVLMSISQQGRTAEMVFTIMMMLLGYLLPDIDCQVKKSKMESILMEDFTRFTYRLSLYVSSGMTVYQAFKQSTLLHEESYFYDSVNLLIRRSEGGNIFMEELVSFSDKMVSSDINSLVAMLCQHIKNGGEIKERLSAYSREMWIKRKNIALKKGEKASVKMVFPLTLGLLGVILILVTPAIMMLKQI